MSYYSLAKWEEVQKWRHEVKESSEDQQESLASPCFTQGFLPTVGESVIWAMGVSENPVDLEIRWMASEILHQTDA